MSFKRDFGISSLHLLNGYNADIDVGTEELVPVARGTLVASVGYVASIVSSDAADDGDPAGTGAQTATIKGIALTSYLPIEETVTLNGTGAVTTTLANFIRINEVVVGAVGSGGTNAGTLTTSLNSQSQDVVPIGRGRSASAVYAVPASQEAVIDRIDSSLSVASGVVTNILFEYRSYATLAAPGPWISFDLGILKSSAENNRLSVPVAGYLVVPPKHEFRVRFTSATANLIGSAQVYFGLRPK